MGDTGAPEPAAAGGGDTGLGPRVSALEAGQTSISDKLDQVLGFLGSTPDKPAEGEPERPEVNIADEIRRQFEERDRKAAKEKPAEPAAPAKAAELAEKPPVAPVRRVTKFMWGGDD